MRRLKGQRGNSLVEFALVGIPLIFAWISTVQLALGMWQYHSLQYAVKAAGSFQTHRGANWVQQGNAAAQIKDAAQVLADNVPGVAPSKITVVFKAINTLTSASQTVTCTLNNCLTNTTAWPPTNYNSPGFDVEISASFLFNSGISMVAPGPGPSSVSFGSYQFPGYTKQFILF